MTAGGSRSQSGLGQHEPVMLSEMLDALAPRPGEIYIDATFGRGGYTQAILARAPCKVIAIDRDPEAIAAARRLPEAAEGRLEAIEGRFGEMDRLVLRPSEIDGIAMDLGVSSPQIDEPARGFSFRADGPLDMRMSGVGPTAADAVNELPEGQLADIVFEYGEERHARRVARAIVSARAERRIERTGELAEIVRRVVPRSRDGIDPATRTFQALRIYVNDELGELDRGLEAAERLLAPGGRLVVVSFHSLEDRKVKRFLVERSGRGAGPSRHLPPVAVRGSGGRDRSPTFTVLTRRPIEASAEEAARNPRARSARLRAAIRTDAPAWMGVAA